MKQRLNDKEVVDHAGSISSLTGQSLYAAREALKKIGVWNHEALKIIGDNWNMNYRHWHGPRHLWDWAFYVSVIPENEISGRDRSALMAVAVIHDVIYDPTCTDNEERSVDCLRKLKIEDEYYDKEFYELVVSVVLNTRPSKSNFLYTHKSSVEDRLSVIANRIDYGVLEGVDWKNLINYEQGIRKEYQHLDWAEYKDKRIGFLSSIKDPFLSRSPATLIELINALPSPNIAVYPGTFNQFHKGHLSVIRYLENMFDKVIIAVGGNPAKNTAPDAIKQVSNDLKKLLRHHQVEPFFGFFTDFVKSLPYPVTIARGLRTDTDFKSEEVNFRYMQDLDPNIKLIYVPCEKKHEHVSSSGIRMMNTINKDKGTELYVPTYKEIYSCQNGWA